jgi:cell division protein FtsW (lipid II flippase)
MFGGFVIMLVVSFVDYHLIVRYSRLFYIVAIILLILVLLPGIGQEVNGATRWMVIGSGDNGIQFQPSEFAKILLILFFAGFFYKHREKLNTPGVLIGAVILFLIPAILILREPNLSTTIIAALIFITLLFIAGLSYKIIIGALAISVPLGVIGRQYIPEDVLPWLIILAVVPFAGFGFLKFKDMQFEDFMKAFFSMTFLPQIRVYEDTDVNLFYSLNEELISIDLIQQRIDNGDYEADNEWRR